MRNVVKKDSIIPYRCMTSKGEPGKGDFEIEILFKWMSEKHEKFWIKDLCKSTREDNDQILK